MGTSRDHDRDPGEAWRERASAAVASGGRRAGGARQAVIGLLSRERCALSAQEIGAALRERGDRVGLASVYRALDVLEGEGLLQRIDLPEGGSRFEPALPGGEHHHHAICEVCGELTPFEDERLERAIGEIAARIPHRIRGHDVVLRGVCERCGRRRDR